MNDIERRAWSAQLRIETRADKGPMLAGHAAVFDVQSNDLGGFREQIQAGAFAEALQDDVRLLINHEGLPLARTRSGTLRLREDAKGLAFEADLDGEDPDVRALLPKISRGDVGEMSFGFRVKKGGQNWRQDEAGRDVRVLTRVGLFDVSVVTFPAYPATDVALRSLEAARAERRCGQAAQTITRARQRLLEAL